MKKILIGLVTMLSISALADSCSDLAAGQPDRKFKFIARCTKVLKPIFDMSPQYSAQAPSDVCLARMISDNKTIEFQIRGKMPLYGIDGTGYFGNANAYLNAFPGILDRHFGIENKTSIKLQDLDIGGEGAFFSSAEYDILNKTLVYRFSTLPKIDSPDPSPSEYYVSAKLSCTAY